MSIDFITLSAKRASDNAAYNSRQGMLILFEKATFDLAHSVLCKQNTLFRRIPQKGEVHPRLCY